MFLSQFTWFTAIASTLVNLNASATLTPVNLDEPRLLPEKTEEPIATLACPKPPSDQQDSVYYKILSIEASYPHGNTGFQCLLVKKETREILGLINCDKNDDRPILACSPKLITLKELSQGRPLEKSPIHPKPAITHLSIPGNFDPKQGGDIFLTMARKTLFGRDYKKVILTLKNDPNSNRPRLELRDFGKVTPIDHLRVEVSKKVIGISNLILKNKGATVIDVNLKDLESVKDPN